MAARSETQGRSAGPAAHQGKLGEIFGGTHPVLWNLHLDLERVAAAGIAPIIRIGETAGGSCRHERSRDTRDVQPELPCPGAVDVDSDGRVVERLGELQVPERPYFRQLGPEFLRESPPRLQVGALDGHFDRGGRSEAHHLADDVRRFERNGHIREFALEASPQILLERLGHGRCFGPQSDAKHGFLLPARKKIDRVDRVARGLDTHKVRRYGHILRPDHVAENVESPECNRLRPLDAGSSRGAQPQLKLAGLGGRKNFRPDPRIDGPYQQSGADRIKGCHGPTEAQDPSQVRSVEITQSLQWAVSLLSVDASDEPGREERHLSAGEQVRGEHRESDGKRQWHEELPADARHEERRDKHGKHAEHGEQARHRCLTGRFYCRPGGAHTRRDVRMDAFNGDRGLIHQDPDGQGQAAKCHDVDSLPRKPEECDGGEECHWDRGRDHEGAAEAAEE